MHTFAHVADCHLGAFRDPVLRTLSLQAFEQAMDRCVAAQVAFIVISGDLFHANLPDMAVVNRAVRKMRAIRDAGINLYVIYGSHDFSPNETSVVDLLASAGLFQKIVKGAVRDGKLRLTVFTDPTTKARLVGISGRSVGLERKYFEVLDRAALEREAGFKIFAFHTALDELKPAAVAQMESMPMSYLPRGFDYYAGGHLHTRVEAQVAGYGAVRYPGALFGYNFRDLEQNAKGGTPGFFLVTFDDRVRDVEFVTVPVCEYLFFEYDAANQNAHTANETLTQRVKALPVDGKLVLIRVRGELSGGKTADIQFHQLRSILRQNGARYVNINRYALSSKEYVAIRVAGDDVHEVEATMLRENIGAVSVAAPGLKGDQGVRTAVALLEALRHDKKTAELKKAYDDRMVHAAVETLRLTEAMA
jgi:DNA repair exonuclease SbcCD nuclease subunit